MPVPERLPYVARECTVRLTDDLDVVEYSDGSIVIRKTDPEFVTAITLSHDEALKLRNFLT